MRKRDRQAGRRAGRQTDRQTNRITDRVNSQEDRKRRSVRGKEKTGRQTNVNAWTNNVLEREKKNKKPTNINSQTVDTLPPNPTVTDHLGHDGQ